MVLLDAFLRFSGIGLLWMLAALTAIQFPKWKSAPYLVLTCISVSALFFGYAPGALELSGIPFVLMRLLDVPHLVFVWLFALSLFNADFKLSSLHVLIGVLYCAPIVWVRFEEFGWGVQNPPFIGPVISILSLALIGHLCVTTLRGRKGDLLNKRRASRIYFVIIIAFIAIVSAISEPFIPNGSDWRQTSKVIAIWPAIIWGFVWMTALNRKSVTFAPDETAKNPLSERDRQLGEKLSLEMSEGQAFKNPDLNIVILASKLGVTQHRLRALINQTLGFKNFSAFVNSYRIQDAKIALRDKKNEHIPILTLALDSGFNSLSSFNRVFKASENLTPSEYRKGQNGS